jgi:uridine phosphorylase
VPQTAHLRPTAPFAGRALLPGDPARALALAQQLLDEPRMFNHARGLWGYTGTAPDGRPLTIQSTGLGGPSAAIVVSELCDLGLRAAVRVGTCGALDGAAAPGELVCAREALARDGTSAALGAGARVPADPALTAALGAGADHTGTIVSTDLFYDPASAAARAGLRDGALALDLQGAAVLAVAARRDVRAGCLLAVVRGPAGDELEGEALDAAIRRLGRVGAEALAEA